MNELTTVRTASNVEAYRASTEAADLCREIVIAASSSIQGRNYVSVEGWQAIARAHGCAAGARDVERVEGGVRAIGEVRDILTGALIATAEGFVGEDEPTWYGGQMRGKTLPKRNDYAIRAMAQTRAMSRACRSAFAHVVVMMKAGLSTTPLEEVPLGGFDRETGEIIEAPAKVPGIQKIKNAIREMKSAGDALTDLVEFNQLIDKYEEQCGALKEANHSWWTGQDGEGGEFEGVPAWIGRRQAELTPVAESASYQLLVSTLMECTTRPELDAWTTKNMALVDILSDEERRKFEEKYDAAEAAIIAAAPLGAG